jgi:putative transposase
VQIKGPRLTWRSPLRHASIGPKSGNRLWEEIYLKAYADGREAKVAIADWMTFYNTERPHTALAHRTPMEVFRGCAPAVDMLDNACALPTDPQQEQQTQPLAA